MAFDVEGRVGSGSGYADEGAGGVLCVYGGGGEVSALDASNMSESKALTN